VDLRERWYFSWLTPWLVGLPDFHAKTEIVSLGFFLLDMCGRLDRGGGNEGNLVHFVWGDMRAEGVGVRTIGRALGHRPLPSPPAHADAVDDIALLGLVAQSPCFIRARRARGAVHHVQLAELY